MTLESLGPNSRQAGLIESACRSPTRLTDASASSRAVFSESDRRFVDCSGSNGGPFKALSTVGRSSCRDSKGPRWIQPPGSLQKTDNLVVSAYRLARYRGMKGRYSCYEHLECRVRTSFNLAVPAERTEPPLNVRGRGVFTTIEAPSGETDHLRA